MSELLTILNSPNWPYAVEPFDFHSEREKEYRAKNIIEIGVGIHLEKLNFLDFGCGEGHITKFASAQKPHIAVGFDIKKSGKWDSWSYIHNLLYTTDWRDVENSGPFDIILVWDVIDHMTVNAAVENLKKLKLLLAPHGKIILRTHPWTSRHGSHLYLQLNKAYAHLAFTEEELKSLGFHQEEVLKFLDPMEDYKSLLDAANLKLQEGPYVTELPVESFFKETELVRNAISANFEGHFPEDILEIQFLDYILY